MRTDADVIVVGGGLAGLTAAAAARAAGRSVILLEKGAAGGRGRTNERQGFLFNFGGHAFYRGGPGEAVLRRLGVRPLGEPPPLERFRLLGGGDLHALPYGPTSLLGTTALGVRSKARLATLLGRLPLMKPSAAAGLSVDEWIGDHDLRSDAEAVVRALVRIATYGADTSVLSADTAIHQLQLGSSKSVLYLHGGWAQLVDALSAGLDIRSAAVTSVDGSASGVEVHAAGEVLTARAAVVATGDPGSTLSLLPADPGWGELTPPNRVACLDAGLSRAPEPGYVLGMDEAVFGTTASPPARMSPEGRAAVAVVRYGTTTPAADRSLCEQWLFHMGVRVGDVEVSRFLPHVDVVASIPAAASGGMAGRPRVDATGMDNVFLAGDWVGPDGYLADASFASGEAAALAASRAVEQAATMVA